MPAPALTSAVLAALTGVGHPTRWTFRYDLADSTGALIGTLDTVRPGGFVTYNSLADVHRRAVLDLADLADVNWSQDRVRPVAVLGTAAGPAEWPLGEFLVADPEGSVRRSGRTWRVVAYDQRTVIVQKALTTRYRVAAGTNVVTQVVAMLNNDTGPRVNYVTSTKTLPADRDWPPGTSRAGVMDQMLSSIGYRPVHYDADGVAQVVPYVAPNAAPVVWDYYPGPASIVLPDSDLATDSWDTPNVWVGYVSNPDQAALRSVLRNDDPDSPTSTVSRGRDITDVRRMDAVDQASLDAQVARLAREATLWQRATVRSGLVPLHGHANVFRWRDEALSVPTTRWRETGWRVPLEAGGVMDHYARRVVDTVLT
jgi:hypothetical protein